MIPLAVVLMNNFKDFKPKNSASPGLEMGKQYIEKLIALSADIDDSCSLKNQRRKRQASSIFSILDGILAANSNNPDYTSLAYATKNLKHNKLFKACG